MTRMPRATTMPTGPRSASAGPARDPASGVELSISPRSEAKARPCSSEGVRFHFATGEQLVDNQGRNCNAMRFQFRQRPSRLSHGQALGPEGVQENRVLGIRDQRHDLAGTLLSPGKLAQTSVISGTESDKGVTLSGAPGQESVLLPTPPFPPKKRNRVTIRGTIT